MRTNFLQKSEQERLRLELIKIVFQGLRKLTPFSLRSLNLPDLLVVAEIITRLEDLEAAQQVNRAAQNTSDDFLNAARPNADFFENPF